MSPVMVMILMMAASAGLRVLLGARHPAGLIPLIIACGVWSGEVRGSRWQWAFLSVGTLLTGLTIWLTIDLVERRRHLTDSG